jgi:hypothetical protein
MVAAASLAAGAGADSTTSKFRDDNPSGDRARTAKDAHGPIRGGVEYFGSLNPSFDKPADGQWYAMRLPRATKVRFEVQGLADPILTEDPFKLCVEELSKQSAAAPVFKFFSWNEAKFAKSVKLPAGRHVFRVYARALNPDVTFKQAGESFTCASTARSSTAHQPAADRRAPRRRASRPEPSRPVRPPSRPHVRGTARDAVHGPPAS